MKSKRPSRAVIDKATEKALFKIGRAEEIGAKSCPIKCPWHGISRSMLRTELKKNMYDVVLPPKSEYLVVLIDYTTD